MRYEWNRTLSRHHRLKKSPSPVSQNALVFSSEEFEVRESISEIDKTLKEKVDIWLSPSQSHLKPILEGQNQVRRVYLSPCENPEVGFVQKETVSARVHGRYEKILIWEEMS